MALASYVLAGYFKGEVKSTEAALKYFVLGAFSSGVLLYGLSLVYGVAGKLGLPELAKLLAGTERSNLLMLGVLLLLSGLLFKIAAVPFHVWTPDVYEGSPTPITAFFSVGPKVAAYAILARIFYVAFPKFQADWGLIVAIVSAATMIFGNVAALLQTNVKRMLAYSSIANAGYALLGVLGFSTEWGLWGILIYLLAYTFMNFGAFTLVILLESKGYAGESVSDFNGLAQRNMPAAIVMLLFLLSLAGIPPTAGFIGKYYLFTAAMKAGYPVARVHRGARVGRVAVLLLPDRVRDVLHGRRGLEAEELVRALGGRPHLRRGDADHRRGAPAVRRGAEELRAAEVAPRPRGVDACRRPTAATPSSRKPPQRVCSSSSGPAPATSSASGSGERSASGESRRTSARRWGSSGHFFTSSG